MKGGENLIREWLMKYRNSLNYTHQDIANSCDITRSYYTQIESGLRSPSVVVAKKIAHKLKFNWTIFLKDECNDEKQSVNRDSSKFQAS